MALNPSTNGTMAGRITAADANYPRGSSKDETGAGVGDGTPYFKARADDIFGFQQALLESAGIVPSGNADTALVSEYMQAVVELASGRAFNYDDSGVADAYVFDVQTDQQAPQSLFDGLIIQGFVANNNTGASTIDPGGLGVTNIKLEGGVTNPAAGQIDSARLNKFIFRSSPSAHFELDITGTNKVQVITVSDAAFVPTPGAKTIEFTVIGPGGGSGGVDGQGAGTTGISGPGGGGATCIKVTQNIEASYNIVIGAGGLGGILPSNPGAAGSSTTVTSTALTLVAGSGTGGGGMVGTSGASISNGGLGGTASGGDINTRGGDAGISSVISGLRANLPMTGRASIGGGSPPTTTGADSSVFGEGGPGVFMIDSATNIVGRPGQQGVVFVRESF